MKRLLFLVVLLLLSGPVVAYEWVFITENYRGVRYFYDTGAVERTRGYNRVWIKIAGATSSSNHQMDFHRTSAKFRFTGETEWTPINPDCNVMGFWWPIWKVCSKL